VPRQPKRQMSPAEPSTPWLRVCVVLLWLPIGALFKLRWRHIERIPTAGPAIVVVNHVSYADPFVVARYIYDAGRAPRFLAKRSLFSLKLIGRVLRGAGQIPVDRGTSGARQSLDESVAALRRGEVIIVYPEGTVTRDPNWWPMVGKTGAARLALLAPDVPVIPVAQWGAQLAVDVYHKRYRPLPRKAVTVTTGPPLDMSRFRGRAPTTQTLRDMTEVIMRALCDLLGDLRAEQPPTSELFRFQASPDADATAGPRGPEEVV
jgi:1-acyl-sn-glycerol-3-phosphate acyltransferase